jgi:hypothetical protein
MPVIPEAEAGRWGIQGQPGLYSEFSVSLDYIERHCFFKKNSIFQMNAHQKFGGKVLISRAALGCLIAVCVADHRTTLQRTTQT